MGKRGRPKGAKTQAKLVPVIAKPVPLLRVCLGPGAGLHSFLSTDPANRVCARCRERQKTLGRLMVEPPVRAEGM